MKALGVIVLFVALVAGFGFYRGWFSVASNNADATSKFTLTVDNEKVRVDRKAATEKVADLGIDVKDRVAGPGGKVEGASPVSTQENTGSATENTEGLKVQTEADVTEAGERIHDGTIVSVGDELKMLDKEGNEHAHTVAANVSVTRDGKVCNASDLKPGMRVRVTTASAEPHMVTRIEALEHGDAFERADRIVPQHGSGAEALLSR